MLPHKGAHLPKLKISLFSGNTVNRCFHTECFTMTPQPSCGQSAAPKAGGIQRENIRHIGHGAECGPVSEGNRRLCRFAAGKLKPGNVFNRRIGRRQFLFEIHRTVSVEITSTRQHVDHSAQTIFAAKIRAPLLLAEEFSDLAQSFSVSSTDQDQWVAAWTHKKP